MIAIPAAEEVEQATAAPAWCAATAVALQGLLQFVLAPLVPAAALKRLAPLLKPSKLAPRVLDPGI